MVESEEKALDMLLRKAGAEFRERREQRESGDLAAARRAIRALPERRAGFSLFAPRLLATFGGVAVACSLMLLVIGRQGAPDHPLHAQLSQDSGLSQDSEFSQDSGLPQDSGLSQNSGLSVAEVVALADEEEEMLLAYAQFERELGSAEDPLEYDYDVERFSIFAAEYAPDPAEIAAFDQDEFIEEPIDEFLYGA
ncbi:MAG: hypothetical protein KDD69_02705 [Bdellovibrionales bacterium]|nr:hypothetical protein [Bdellovibrionales bacterium]